MEELSTTPDIETSFKISNDSIKQADTENAVIETLNQLIVFLNISHPRVSSLQHISSDIYASLFEKIFGYKPLDLVSVPKNTEDEAHNIQCIIDTLSLDILGVSLSHITGEDILNRNPLSIQYLLEIISEFSFTQDSQTSRSSISVPVSSSSTKSTSNVSHTEHFCPVCEYGLAQSHRVPEKTDSTEELGNFACPSCSLRTYSPAEDAGSVSAKQGSSEVLIDLKSTSTLTDDSIKMTKETAEDFSEIPERTKVSSGDPSLNASHPPRKDVEQKLTFNEKLSQKLITKLEDLKKASARSATNLGDSESAPVHSMDELYRSFFQKSVRKKVPTPSKQSSVLIPRYLRKRKSLSPHSKPASSKKQKRQPTVRIEKPKGILEEIKSEVPGVRFTCEGLNVLELQHQRQVKLLSSRLSSLQEKISASEKIIQENILKQVQLADLDEKDKETTERLNKVKSLQRDRLKARGAFTDSGIRRARLKRYFDQYHVQHKRKLSRQQYRGEVLLRDLYKDRLTMQKQQLIDVSKDLREQEKEEAVKLGNRIASLQNCYAGRSELQKAHHRDQAVQEQERVKAQQQVLEQTRKAILKQIEKEVKEIQENLEKQDTFHFVETDAERLRESWSKTKTTL